MGLFLSRSFGAAHLSSFISFFVRPKARFFVPTRASLGPARAGAVKVGRRTNLAASLTAPSTMAPLDAVEMTIRGEPALRARINRATTLYPVGPRPYHDAAMRIGSEAPKRRTHSSVRHKSHGNISGPRHLEPSSATRHKRTDLAEPVGCLQQPRFIAPGAERHLLAPRPPAQTATRRSEACAPRPRSWSCDCRGRSRCGLETTAPRRCPSGT
jgi:hypothetical protein